MQHGTGQNALGPRVNSLDLNDLAVSPTQALETILIIIKTRQITIFFII